MGLSAGGVWRGEGDARAAPPPERLGCAVRATRAVHRARGRHVGDDPVEVSPNARAAAAGRRASGPPAESAPLMGDELDTLLPVRRDERREPHREGAGRDGGLCRVVRANAARGTRVGARHTLSLRYWTDRANSAKRRKVRNRGEQEKGCAFTHRVKRTLVVVR